MYVPGQSSQRRGSIRVCPERAEEEDHVEEGQAAGGGRRQRRQAGRGMQEGQDGREVTHVKFHLIIVPKDNVAEE